MKQILASVTERGQVTIPAEVRRTLGLVPPRGKITFAVDDDGVRLMPASYTLESTFGSVQPLARPEDFKGLAQQARTAAAERTVAKMRRR